VKGAERVGWIPRIKYLARDSPLDRLNPLPKLTMLVGGTVAVFVLHQTWQLLVFLAVLIALFPVARVHLWEVRAAVRFFLVFSLLLMAIHALFVHSGEAVWQAGLGTVTVTITWGGLILGLHMVIRFLVVVLGSFLFVATTEPNKLAHSLMRAGLPYKAGFALVLALRLMPLMRSESNSVREAQAARGLALDKGGLRAVVTSVRSTIGPLLVSSLSRVDSLVVSMEGRAFGRTRERTFLREVLWGPADSTLLVLAVLLPLAVVGQRWFL
jgi:energy-coupling factor transport system permease protein